MINWLCIVQCAAVYSATLSSKDWISSLHAQTQRLIIDNCTQLYFVALIHQIYGVVCECTVSVIVTINTFRVDCTERYNHVFDLCEVCDMAGFMFTRVLRYMYEGIISS